MKEYKEYLRELEEKPVKSRAKEITITFDAYDNDIEKKMSKVGQMLVSRVLSMEGVSRIDIPKNSNKIAFYPESGLAVSIPPHIVTV